MRHPLAFPVQPFLFSLLVLFAWHVEVRGPEVNKVQQSGTKHISLEISFPGRFVFRGILKEQDVIIVYGCTNKTKVRSSGLMAMEASDFSGWL